MDDSNDLFSSMGTQAASAEPKTEIPAAAAPQSKQPEAKAAKPQAPKPAAKGAPASGDAYDASAIEVLEGLEPVRRRPGMYIGGTDERALHHLFAEVIDNSMDEAVAGHANFIEVELDAEGYLTVPTMAAAFQWKTIRSFPANRRLK
ncbi:hypothetical protein HPDFL43_00024040 [Hoeflea phototrophica DFL-43]|uniref:DNA topoisomerase (ATP-hydrolyzing) n=1 Tax=Hoeflea phototrophica (strain DSM 17068 / NCIMB 14078 / DFL-43) TaxID=411684 RepID=A0A094Z2D6_HOEPD|nr:hypothetical protein HPDFL43_00024040 [Hoeflea phototrophica DFL-43]